MFKTYGTGNAGGKAEDLQQYEDLLLGLGFNVVADNWVILDGEFKKWAHVIFHDFDCIDEKKQSYYLQGTVPFSYCPESLLAINRQILSELTVGHPYVIRSSARSERGGTGIFASTFFIPTGNFDQDLLNLYEAENVVYSSEFSPAAEAWRAKTGYAPGMAILIQPVVSKKTPLYVNRQWGEYYLPALSGTAYTSYQGVPVVRATVGLGTTAVRGDGCMFYESPDTLLHLHRDLWDQDEGEAIDALTGKVVKVGTHFEEIYSYISHKGFSRLFDLLNELAKHGDFSLEWAMVGEGIVVTQISPYEDKVLVDWNISGIDADKMYLLVEGSDVYNSGRASCAKVIWVVDWGSNTGNALKLLNDQYKDYVLVIPSEAMSLLSGHGVNRQKFGFEHFSNAKAVVERQSRYTHAQMLDSLRFHLYLVDHSRCTGASHFQQLCSRSDILFVGAVFDWSMLSRYEPECQRNNIYVLDAAAEVVVDAVAKRGLVYLAKPEK